MMLKNKNLSNLAIIPARGGSKRLKNKNKLQLSGKPLVLHTVEAALKSQYVTDVLVSSDNDEILDIACNDDKVSRHKRENFLATDTSTALELVDHIVTNSTKRYDFVTLMLPTCPLRTHKHLDQALDKILSKIDVPKDIEISEKLEKQLDEDEDLIKSFVEDAQNIQKDLDSETESEFLKSKIEGLSSLFTNDSNIIYESLDTNLTVSMLMAWPYINKNIKTRKECFKFLVVKLGESQIGSYERVEKFFERIKFSPAVVGRPKI